MADKQCAASRKPKAKRSLKLAQDASLTKLTSKPTSSKKPRCLAHSKATQSKSGI